MKTHKKEGVMQEQLLVTAMFFQIAGFTLILLTQNPFLFLMERNKKILTAVFGIISIVLGIILAFVSAFV